MKDFNTNTPIYLQVVDDIKMQIMSGTLLPGDKIASVRELAQELSVNPNTVQKAFVELEREGFIRTERAVGRYVTEDQKLIDDYKEQFIKESVHDFLEQMKVLGIDIDEVQRYLNEEGKHENVD